MEETNTTIFSLSNRTYAYGDYWEDIYSYCSTRSYRPMVFSGVCVGISVFGLAGNGKVVWLLGFRVKQNPFTVYILNLAVADFFLLLLFFLLMLAVLIFTTLCLYDFLYFFMYFIVIAQSLCHFFDLSSLGLLTAISVERCVSVLFPIWYRCRRPKHLSGIVSGVLWACAGFFISSLYLNVIFGKSYVITFSVVVIAIPMILSLIVLVSNLSLFIKLRCASLRRQPGRFYVAVLLNVVFFLALGIPFSVAVFLHFPRHYSLLPGYIYFLLAVLNSTVNPVIYFLVGNCRQRRIQGSMKVALRRLFEEDTMREEESHQPEAAEEETTV